MHQLYLRSISAKLIIIFLILSFIVIILLPFLWMALTALKTQDQVLKVPPIYIPTKLTLANFKYFIGQGGLRYGLNSLIVTFLTLLVTLILVIPAAYGCSRYKFRLKPFLLVFLVCTQMFPGILLIVPMYKIMHYLHLLDTYTSLVIANATVALPFSILMLITFFDSVPIELDEAALVDGANRFKIITKNYSSYCYSWHNGSECVLYYLFLE